MFVEPAEEGGGRHLVYTEGTGGLAFGRQMSLEGNLRLDALPGEFCDSFGGKAVTRRLWARGSHLRWLTLRRGDEHAVPRKCHPS